MKESISWYSERVREEVQFVRWGTMGRPVLLYPTAGGDAEEIERFLMIKVLAPLLEEGRIKIYSIDSLPARDWGDREKPAAYAGAFQNAFDSFVYHEVVPAIRRDCNDDDIEIVTAGASIGAFNALASLCRHPDVFKLAICMSGSYDVERFIKGPGEPGPEFAVSSPRLFLPGMGDGPHLDKLRERFVLMCHGGGRWEDPNQDWGMAELLGSKGIPNRVDAWGEGYDHDWPTWRAMLPKYLAEVD